MNVLLAGLTGSGKTSCGKALSADLSLGRISASEIRYGRRGISGSEDATGEELRRAWLDGPFDDGYDLDAELVRLQETSLDTVFDAWLLPWLVPAGPLRVWLEASLGARADRLASTLRVARTTDLSIEELVLAKDEAARRYGLSRYAIDIYVDREPFDLIIDTEAITFAQITRILSALVRAALSQTPQELDSEDRETASLCIRRCPQALARLTRIAR